MKRKVIAGGLLLAITVLSITACGKTKTASTEVNQSELLQMINQGDSIEIEVAVPLNEEQGTENQMIWEELASLTTNPEIRKSWDDTLGIINTDTGKNGVLYVGVGGENDNNNTLHVALHNREFLKQLENEDTVNSLAHIVAENYVDIEVSTEDNTNALLMGINSYFNLLPDSSPNYSNPNATLQRNEFMAMVMRAETPVQELKVDSAFENAVGKNDLNIYAQSLALAGDSYLDINSKSLDNLTYNGTITRAEAIYLLVSHYFKDELNSVDLKTAETTVKFTDAKDGGDIASREKFIEKGKAKDYWKSYELTYSLQNPDAGLPTELYKALVVAKEKNIISDIETRWDEGLTKVEALELLVNTLKADDSIPMFNAKMGKVNGYEAEQVVEETKQVVEVESTVEDVEESSTEIETEAVEEESSLVEEETETPVEVESTVEEVESTVEETTTQPVAEETTTSAEVATFAEDNGLSYDDAEAFLGDGNMILGPNVEVQEAPDPKKLDLSQYTDEEIEALIKADGFRTE